MSWTTNIPLLKYPYRWLADGHWCYFANRHSASISGLHNFFHADALRTVQAKLADVLFASPQQFAGFSFSLNLSTYLSLSLTLAG